MEFIDLHDNIDEYADLLNLIITFNQNNNQKTL